MKLPIWFSFIWLLAAACFPPFSHAADTAQNGGAVPASITPDAQGRVLLRLPEIEVFDAILIYEKLSGKTLVMPAGTDTTTKLTLMALEPMPPEQALQMISAALLLNGYALVPGEKNRIHVAPVKSTNPRGMGLPVYAGPAGELPGNSSIITYFMPFTYLSAKDAQAVFTQQVALNQPYGVIVPVPNAQALLITENVSVVRRLIEIKKLIDVPPTELTIEFVQLESASAPVVVETLKRLMQPDTGSSINNEGFFNVTFHTGDKSDPLKTADFRPGTVQVIPDVRTNRVMVMGPKQSAPLFVSLVRKLDATASLNEPKKYRLKFVAASDMVGILQTALADRASSDAPATPPPTPVPAAKTTASGGSSLSGSGIEGLVAESEDASRAISVVVGNTRLIADNRTNTLIVIGPPSSWMVAEKVMEIMDRPPKQVYLATVIGELYNNGTQEMGVDLLQKFAKSGDNKGIASIMNNFTLKGVTEPRAVTTGAALTSAANGLTVYGLIGNEINAYLHVLSKTDRWHLLSRPSVYTSNNKKAVISSGVQQPVPSTTQSDVVSGGGTTVLNTTIDYKDVLLQLAVVPLINANNDVTLNIAQCNDTVGEEVDLNTVTAYAFNRQHLNTSVTVANSQTVVIGGVLSDKDEFHKIGVPLLGDIPGLEYLFSTRTKTRLRRELIVLIQPTVIEPPENAFTEDKETMERLKTIPTLRDIMPPEKDKKKKTEPAKPRGPQPENGGQPAPAPEK
ncbi:MAG: secretin N-terminal domain-containing protein [Verrucomicrobiae bacterium]|nr:secretin N-terminal domain-containing protein [Verrucomicrobiae bacterium]